MERAKKRPVARNTPDRPTKRDRTSHFLTRPDRFFSARNAIITRLPPSPLWTRPRTPFRPPAPGAGGTLALPRGSTTLRKQPRRRRDAIGMPRLRRGRRSEASEQDGQKYTCYGSG